MRWRPALGLVVLLVTGCGHEPAPRVERTLDFLARLDQARVEADQPYRVENKVWGDRFRNTDDSYLPVLVLPDMAMVFEDVAIHRQATLHYVFGANKVLPDTPRGAVTFHILVEAGSQRAETSQTVAPDSGDRVVGTLDLRALAGAKARFTFRTTAADDASTWPAWHELRLTSKGRERTAAESRLHLTEPHLDLLDLMDRARVTEQSEAQPVVRTVMGMEPGEDTRDGPFLRAAPPSRVQVDVSVPEHGLLDLEYVRLPGDEGTSDANVRFLVEVDGEVLWTDSVTPAHEPRRHAAVDLSRFAGQDVALNLVTRWEGDGQGDSGARVGWIRPRLMVEHEVPRQARDRDQPDVLLIVVDTLRADRLGAYGCERDTSPHFDRLASQGILFRRMTAASSWTLPTTASLLTGLHPLSHGVLNERLTFLDEDLVTVAESLQEEGFTTGAFVGNPLVSPHSNFDQGFEEFQVLPWANARKIVHRTLDWMDEHEGDRLFTYLHMVDPHDPYEAPEGHRDAFVTEGNRYQGMSESETLAALSASLQGQVDLTAPEAQEALVRLRDLYDAEVLYWDLWLGHLLEELEDRGRLENTIILITADHGEEFLEHGMYQHGLQLYEESVRVPFLVVDPRRKPGEISERLQTVDVAPTLRALLELDPSPRLQGRDGLGDGPAGPVFTSTETGREADQEGRLTKNAVISGPWKLVSIPSLDRFRLFQLEQDPNESHDVHSEHPREAEALRRLLQKWIEDTLDLSRGPFAGFDEETLLRLKEFGYLDR